MDDLENNHDCGTTMIVEHWNFLLRIRLQVFLLKKNYMPSVAGRITSLLAEKISL